MPYTKKKKESSSGKGSAATNVKKKKFEEEPEEKPTELRRSKRLKKEPSSESEDVVSEDVVMEKIIESELGKEEESSESEKEEESDNAPALKMSQLGGGLGSTAGDAFIIKPMKSRRLHMIDFGTGKQRENAIAQRNAMKQDDPSAGESEYETDDEHDVPLSLKNKWSATITHNHADHSGKKEDWKKFGYINLPGDSIPEALRDDSDKEEEGKGKNKKKRKKSVEKAESGEIRKNPEVLFAWRQKKEGEGRLFVRGETILSPDRVEGKKVDENAKSLGAKIIVERQGKGKKRERLYTYLTTGDMEPNASGNVKDSVGKDILNLIKMPHHGSEDNAELLNDLPKGATDDNTVIIVSGFTKKLGKPLFKATNRVKSKKKKIFLFHGGVSREKLDQEVGEAGMRKIKEEFTLGRDFHVEVPKKGSPKSRFDPLPGEEAEKPVALKKQKIEEAIAEVPELKEDSEPEEGLLSKKRKKKGK